MMGDNFFLPVGLLRNSWRYLRQNVWYSLLMILGIAIGVGVVVAIDIANTSAQQSFELSKRAVLGNATHQIIGGPAGMDERIYVEIRRNGIVQAAAPVLEATVTSLQLGDEPFTLLGVDVFADREFRPYLNSSENIPVGQLVGFLSYPGAVLMMEETAFQYGLQIGDPLLIDFAGQQRDAYLVGFLKPVDELTRRALERMLLVDIATAQELLGMEGKIDRIDLILAESEETAAVAQIEALLPDGTQISTSGARSGIVDDMTSAFQINLTALSLLALLVGLFLIYNTITYSVVKRRALFGLLRCIGVTRQQVILLVVGEAFLIGILGSLLGLLIGVLAGQQTVGMVTQTINDLYFTTTVDPVPIRISSMIKGLALGVVATIVTALFPAIEASFIPPRIALSRSGLERKSKNVVRWLSVAGLGLILAGVLVLWIPSPSIFLGFAGTLLVVLGIAMESTIALVLSMRILRPFSGKFFGFLGKMAPSSLVNNLSRTSVAIASLMVAVAVAIGMNLMVNSFRSTVTIWLEQTLMGDIYVSAPSFVSSNPTETIRPEVIAGLEGWSEISRIDTLRTVSVLSRQGPVILNATENPDFGQERQYQHLEIPSRDVWEEMERGGILISEALGYRLGLASGDQLALLSDQGWQMFPIIGVIYEYTSSEGSIWMAYDTYQSYWLDEGITALALRLADGTEADQVTSRIQDSFASLQRLIVRSNRVLREEVMRIFDRTFAITNAMRAMATVVAFIGVLTTAMLLQLEKKREMGILRALGLTSRQLWGLVMIESGLMGLVSGLLALPTGSVLARILVDVINRRSFGWTIQLSIPMDALVQGIALSLIASLIAGIYPAWRLNQMVTAEAIRYE